MPDLDDEELLLQDAARGVYKKLVLRDNKLRGAVMYGDTVDGPWYFQMLRDGTDIAEMREHILFGQAHLGRFRSRRRCQRGEPWPDSDRGVRLQWRVQRHHRQSHRRQETIHAGRGACAYQGIRVRAARARGWWNRSWRTRWVAIIPPSPASNPCAACTEATHEEVRAAIPRAKS